MTNGLILRIIIAGNQEIHEQTKQNKMTKKTIPFDLSKMNKDFSNVVYRDGTRPQFVCESVGEWKILSVSSYGNAVIHLISGNFHSATTNPKDLLLEVEQKYVPLWEFTEDQKRSMTEFTYWYFNNRLKSTGTLVVDGFDTVYTNFLKHNQ